jgi:hypothetical protein
MGAQSTVEVTGDHEHFATVESFYYLFAEKFGRPARGNDKGQIENLVGYARCNFVVPIPRAASWEELNSQLAASCHARPARRMGQTRNSSWQKRTKGCTLPNRVTMVHSRPCPAQALLHGSSEGQAFLFISGMWCQPGALRAGSAVSDAVSLARKSACKPSIHTRHTHTIRGRASKGKRRHLANKCAGQMARRHGPHAKTSQNQYALISASCGQRCRPHPCCEPSRRVELIRLRVHSFSDLRCLLIGRPDSFKRKVYGFRRFETHRCNMRPTGISGTAGKNARPAILPFIRHSR